jgi:hypothetical protein
MKRNERQFFSEYRTYDVSLYSNAYLRKKHTKRIKLNSVTCWAETTYPFGGPVYFSDVRLDRCVIFCKWLFVLLSFFFWSLYCLWFDIRLLITSLVSSNRSYRLRNVYAIIWTSLLTLKWNTIDRSIHVFRNTTKYSDFWAYLGTLLINIIIYILRITVISW